MPQTFFYSVTIHGDQVLHLPQSTVFPRTSELVLSSRNFSAFVDCHRSCSVLLKSLAKKLSPSLTVKTESLSRSVTDGWEDGELAKVWLFDSANVDQDGNTVAVGCASIFSTELNPSSLS